MSHDRIGYAVTPMTEVDQLIVKFSEWLFKQAPHAEIVFDPQAADILEKIRVGDLIFILARLEGEQYRYKNALKPYEHLYSEIHPPRCHLVTDIEDFVSDLCPRDTFVQKAHVLGKDGLRLKCTYLNLLSNTEILRVDVMNGVFDLKD